LHVNRTRPNAFILEQWVDAYRGRDIVKPDASERMSCDGKLCVAEIATAYGDKRIAYVAAAGVELQPSGTLSLRNLCAQYDMVIFAKAPSPLACGNDTPLVTAQKLALRGAAEIRLNDEGETLVARYALPGPIRPWLDHRRFSRAARNLGEWRPRESGGQ
jgi:competence protein ComEC